MIVESSRSLRLLVASTLVALFFLSGCVPSADAEPGHPLTQAIRKGFDGGDATFSHADFDALLRKHVRSNGRVDYAGIKRDHAALKVYLGKLEKSDLTTLPKDEIEALLINAYNAYTLDLMARNYPIKSIKDLSKPWDQDFCKVAGETVSLNFLEHKLLRVKELFDDPRIHFGVNCASIGCPPLRGEAYTGAKIHEQLDDSVRKALRNPLYLKVDGDRVAASEIFKWFSKDFSGKSGSIAKWISGYAPPAPKKILDARGDAALTYMSYDWAINDVEKP